MNISQLFMARYEPLYDFWLAGVWEVVPFDLMRVRPHPAVNSIAWNLWHLTRVEDAGINRFITDSVQVVDEDDWLRRINLPWRHNGCEMDFAEVDALNEHIDIVALHEYTKAVEMRTRAVAAQLDHLDLDATLGEDRLRQILFAEGLAHPRAGGLLQNYLGWSVGKYLMNFVVTHPYQHVGEIGVLASLLGVEFT